MVVSLTAHRNHGNIPRILAIHTRYTQVDDLPSRSFKRLLNVDRGCHFLAVNSQNAIAHCEVQGKLRKRCFDLRIEQPACIDLVHAIAVVWQTFARRWIPSRICSGVALEKFRRMNR